MATESLKGVYDNGDGTYWTKSKKAVSAAVRHLRRQGYAVRSRRLPRSEGGGHEIKIVGTRRMRATVPKQEISRPTTSGSRGVRYRHGAMHRPQHIPAGRSGHVPYGGGGRSGSIAGGGYRGDYGSSGGLHIRKVLRNLGREYSEYKREQERINKFAEQKRQQAIKKQEEDRIRQDKEQTVRQLEKQRLRREQLAFEQQQREQKEQAIMREQQLRQTEVPHRVQTTSQPPELQNIPIPQKSNVQRISTPKLASD